MAGKEDYRIFVGGLSWDVTERELESKFSRFGKVIESQIMLERDTGRPRGFGFITFSDRRGMETAIKEMHGREYGNRVISVNKAQPKVGEDVDHGYRGGGGYSSGDRDRDRDRGSYGRGGDRVDRSAVGQDSCFKCGRAGHWARDCPSGDGGGRGGGGPFSSRSRFGGPVGHGDRFGGDRDRFIDDRYDAARSRDRERFDIRDDKYSSRDRFASDRYPSGGGGGGDRFGSSRYGGADRYAQNGYGKERGYDRDSDARGGASDRYGGGSGGAVRNEGRNYRSRPDPYERPSRAARPSSFDRY